MPGLPEGLRAALEEALAGLPPREVAARSAALSAAYRAGEAPRAWRAEDAAAYAAVRMPATFAAVSAALAQVREQLPGWRPQTLLDVGAGPGTAAWAVSTVWPGLASATLLEREPAMIELGRRLAAREDLELTWRRAELGGAWTAEPHDLVVAAYVLGELPAERRAELIGRLWAAAGAVLVVVEPGTPPGFERVRAARAQLLAAGGHLAAPCPHADACPMAAPDWCHFAARVPRSTLHRRAKGGALGHEDEKFSFVAAAREPAPPVAGRILRHPQARKGHILLQACTPEGLRRMTVSRGEGERYRAARDLGWGSRLPPGSPSR